MALKTVAPVETFSPLDTLYLTSSKNQFTIIISVTVDTLSSGILTDFAITFTGNYTGPIESHSLHVYCSQQLPSQTYQ